ncbi:MAG: tetratricopeptide repeat protein [Cyanobacteria bacterium SZAS TMP-1]|nr:tetratricopeptide repeat protein [Cyanobacteria bacterium SZAS TMP-1]
MKKTLATYTLFLFLSQLLAGSAAICAACAAGSPDISKGPASGINWTKVQDLNPNAKSTNYPVRQKYAVVIGASKFKESRLDSTDTKMDLAAKNFVEYLKDANAGRFPETHIKTLINSEATRQNVLANLGKGWLGSLAEPDDLVVVYIATQAFPTTDGGSYLCAYDCALDNPYSTCFSMKGLMETLRQEVKAKRIILIIDSPYSGAAELTAGPGAKRLSERTAVAAATGIAAPSLGSGYAILCSSKADQEIKGNEFSNNLIAALRQNNGMVTIDQAFASARDKTESDTASRGRQTPVMKADWHGGPMVLGTPSTEKVRDIPENVQTFIAAEAHYLKANNFVGAGDFDQAIAEYKEAIKTDATYADAVADYGAVLTIKGDWAGAREQYKTAVTLSPKDALFHANYARVLSKLGEQDEADKQLELAYSLNAKDRVIITALSNRCIAAGNFESAIKLLESAAVLFPESSQLQDKLSYAYARSGNLPQSLVHAKAAVKLDPKSIPSKLNLGSALLLKGDLVSAEAVYMEATALDPKNVDAHYLLAGIMEKLGDHAGAKLELNTFLEIAPANDDRIAKAKERLTAL